jgi:hypothetical protein
MNLKENPLIVLFEYKYRNLSKMTIAVLYLTVFLPLINNPKNPLLNFV